jgi:PadR family transcriptional regulator, regulatory protein PadR
MNDIVDKHQIVRRHMDQLIFDLKRGFLQFAALALINKGAKYAYEIKAEISTITNGLFDIDRNNLYKKLRSLEKDGILKSYAEPSAQGANRKYYALTPFGKKLLDEMYSLLRPVMDTFRKANKS